MAKLNIKPGSTSEILLIFIQDSGSTTGGGKTGLAYNTGSLTCYYVRPGSAAASISLVTQTVTGAWSSGGFVEVDATNLPGVYRFDVPNAVLAANVRSAVVMLKGASGMAPLTLEIDLGGQVDVSAISGDSGAADNAEAFFDGTGYAGTNNVIPTVTTVTNLTNAPTSGDLTAAMKASVNAEVDTALNTAIPGSPTADSINERIVAIDAIGAPPTVNAIADQVWDELLSGHTGAGSAGLALSTASSGGVDPSVLADAIWDEALSGHSTAGTSGKKLTDLTNADLSGVSTAANLALVKADTAAILADTGTDGVVVGSGSKTGYALTSTEHTNIADALLKRDFSAVTGEAARSALNALRFLRNKWSVSGSTLTVTKENDSTAAWTATLSTDAAADPVTGSDPA